VALYASLAELKAQLRIESADTADDAQLTLALTATTEAIDKAMGTTGAQLDPVPASVKLAALLQATRLFKRKEAPFGVAGSLELGSELRLLAKLDPDVEMLLGGYGELTRYGTTV
jgi:hypothetical protein